ncbi:hypothetical protein [Microvirga lotononidis]|uniref:Uncharacterized protein n=1 Tax=Microvirga lotononidis TaxID=864069 RepID=I4Z2L7_9HYPH|nr:hypothetical protein [Microvirga lotononidis]EIM30459.1 hypothetical protein MicloDRAFT_00007080 [Microvirga lotononidis]WQO26300.1 hypothetical protein U0023_16575 [Microvirga lotononidis]
MQIKLRHVIIGLTCVAWITALAFAWFALKYDPSCIGSDKIMREADALEFGKYYLRRHRSIWEDELHSVAELDQMLQTPGCCNVSRINPDENNGREWFVSLKVAKPPGRYFYFYDVQFTSCRYRIEEDGLSVRE